MTIILTKELLKQYNDLQKEIKELEYKIERVKNRKAQVVSDTVKGSPYFPYNERVFKVTGIESDRREQHIEKLNRILLKRKAKCEELKLQIEEFINAIPDSRTRRVFSLRYIDGLNWLQIARKIERYDESYPRKVIHDKYLENLK